MHVDFGGSHVRDVTFVAAFDVDAKKVGRDLSEAIGASENNTIKFADVPPLDVRCCADHPRRARPLLPRDDHRVGRAAGRRGPGAPRHRGRRPGRTCRWAARRPTGSTRRRDRRPGRLRERATGVHRLGPGWADKFARPACRSSATTSRARSARPSRTGSCPAVRGARRAAGPHDAAQRGREHGLPEHEGARAAGAEEISKTQSVTSEVDRELRWDRRGHRPLRRRVVPAWRSAKWATCGWRAGRPVMCRSVSSTSSRSGTNRTRRASSSTRVRAAKIAKDQGIGGPLLSASELDSFMSSSAELQRRGGPPGRRRSSSAESGNGSPLTIVAPCRPRTWRVPRPGPNLFRTWP